MAMERQGGARKAPAAAAGRGRTRRGGDDIPCSQCPNPRECMAAGKCMLKEGQGMKRGGKVMAKKAGAKKSTAKKPATGMKRGGKVTAKKPAARKR